MTIFASNSRHNSTRNSGPMSKILLLLRHAQSAGRQGNQPDYERRLTPEGEAMADRTGLLIQQNLLTPDYILSSSAVRTRQTVEQIRKNLQVPMTHIGYLPELYEASAMVWMDQIHQLDDSMRCVILVGHNPAISALTSTFADRAIDLPPCGLMAFEFPAMEWIQISGPGREITRIINP